MNLTYFRFGMLINCIACISVFLLNPIVTNIEKKSFLLLPSYSPSSPSNFVHRHPAVLNSVFGPNRYCLITFFPSILCFSSFQPTISCYSQCIFKIFLFLTLGSDLFTSFYTFQCFVCQFQYDFHFEPVQYFCVSAVFCPCFQNVRFAYSSVLLRFIRFLYG